MTGFGFAYILFEYIVRYSRIPIDLADSKLLVMDDIPKIMIRLL